MLRFGDVLLRSVMYVEIVRPKYRVRKEKQEKKKKKSGKTDSLERKKKNRGRCSVMKPHAKLQGTFGAK